MGSYQSNIDTLLLLQRIRLSGSEFSLLPLLWVKRPNNSSNLRYYNHFYTSLTSLLQLEVREKGKFTYRL